MPRGRPPNKKRNISGLKNQPASSDIRLPPILESAEQNADNYDTPCPHSDEEEDQHKQDMKDFASSEQEDDLDSEFESDHEWKGLTSTELGKKLAVLSCDIDDTNDADWIPYKLRRQKGKKKGK